MQLRTIIEKAKTSSFHMWMLNTVLWRKIPFNNPHKIKISLIEKNAITVTLPFIKKNQNHIKGIHACALATLSEYISGLMLMSSLSEKDYRIILKNISMTYHYQAKMEVHSKFSLTREFIQSEVIEPLKNLDSVFKELTVDVYDKNQNHISTGLINWQIKKWSSVKTKVT
jgi:acyl-coenzyme A thioesterase PaaI-like protein